MAFTDAGSAESVKGACHGALFTMVALCFVYNVCAWRKRSEAHLAVNVGAYGLIAAFEVLQVLRHAGR